MHALVTQAVEDKARAIAPDNLGLQYLVVPLQPEPRYLVLQELMHAVPNGLHRLASAGNTDVTLGTSDQQVLGNRPGLDAAMRLTLAVLQRCPVSHSRVGLLFCDKLPYASGP
jgi:hypothetical protein